MNRIAMLFSKNGSKTLHLSKNIFPIIFIPKSSEYSAAFQKKLNNCPIALSDIQIENSIENYIEEEGAQTVGLKLYLDEGGKIIES